MPNRYPFESVIYFLYKFFPQKPPSQCRVLEVGCGSGNNLWMFAREGYNVAGIDRRAYDIGYAINRFAEDGLPHPDLRIGDLNDPLPWPDDFFDMVVDRGCLSYLGAGMEFALAEIKRVTVTGGRFLFSPYGLGSDPSIVDYDDLHARLVDRNELPQLLQGWRTLDRTFIQRYLEWDNKTGFLYEWNVVCEKLPVNPWEHMTAYVTRSDEVVMGLWSFTWFQ
jgi:SAM-dependent methyltransferase